MSDDEAYERLAAKVRARMSARKLDLYNSIRAIEAFDELRDKELVRQAGETWCFGANVGGADVVATSEQPEAFRISVRGSEWRGYLDEVKRLLEDEDRRATGR